MIKKMRDVIFMGEDEDYHSIDDSIEIEEIQILERKPPNDKIVVHFIVKEEMKR